MQSMFSLPHCFLGSTDEERDRKKRKAQEADSRIKKKAHREKDITRTGRGQWLGGDFPEMLHIGQENGRLEIEKDAKGIRQRKDERQQKKNATQVHFLHPFMQNIEPLRSSIFMEYRP
jgi:hypothetical protein